MQKPLASLRHHWLESVFVLFAVVLLSLLLWFRLESLTYHLAAPIELMSRQDAQSWHTIVNNPLNAPYSILQRLVILSGHSSLAAFRLVSTAFAILAMVLFYLVARQWHSMRVAVLATWLFVSSAWFLHTARLATPEVLWLDAILALVVLFTPRKSERQAALILPILAGTLGVLLYIPGMAWLVLLSVIIRRKNIAQYWHSAPQKILRILSLLLLAVLLAPLVWSFVQNPELIRQWLGIAATLPLPLDMLKHILVVPQYIFVQGPLDPVHWLGRLPLLSVFETVMFLVGIYFYVRHLQAARSRFIIILSGAAWLVIALGGVASLSLLIPAVYLVVTTGIAYMLHEWFAVFPKNPLARTIGVAVVIVAVALTSLYQTRSYFVAWRYSPDTQKVFTKNLQ